MREVGGYAEDVHGHFGWVGVEGENGGRDELLVLCHWRCEQAVKRFA